MEHSKETQIQTMKSIDSLLRTYVDNEYWENIFTISDKFNINKQKVEAMTELAIQITAKSFAFGNLAKNLEEYPFNANTDESFMFGYILGSMITYTVGIIIIGNIFDDAITNEKQQ